jgi:hypothetical protein
VYTFALYGPVKCRWEKRCWMKCVSAENSRSCNLSTLMRTTMLMCSRPARSAQNDSTSSGWGQSYTPVTTIVTHPLAEILPQLRSSIIRISMIFKNNLFVYIPQDLSQLNSQMGLAFPQCQIKWPFSRGLNQI